MTESERMSPWSGPPSKSRVPAERRRSRRGFDALLLETLLFGALVASSGCRCGASLDPIAGGFRASPTAVEFGRVLEGEQATQSVTLQALGRAAVTVTASTAAPFSVPAGVGVPGGGEAELVVTFTAGAAEASGVLSLTAGDASVDVTLHGMGVHPPVCTPSGTCLTSAYSLELDRCVETARPDDSLCDPQNLCLEQGRCAGGHCNAVARTCNDDNACTDDNCSETAGCVHTARHCPAPIQPCQVTTCDPHGGCGYAVAADKSVCGSADCESLHICLLGVCREFPTPEDSPCGVAVACLPVGACKNQRCVQTPVEFTPKWKAPLNVVPTEAAPALLSAGTSLFFSACGLPVHAGALADGGSADGGASDGGSADGGASDGGVCGLGSFTTGGLDRFLTPYSDGLERRLVHLSDRGVLVTGSTGLEYHSPVTGAVQEAIARFPPPQGIALTPDGSVVLLDGDGGLEAWTADGGVRFLRSVGGASVLSVDESGRIYLWDADAGVVSRVEAIDNGGIVAQSISVDAGGTSLTVLGDQAVVGSELIVRPGDGGLEVVGLVQDGWPPWWVPRGALQSTEDAFAFTRRCPTPLVTCAEAESSLWLSVHELGLGQVAWEVEALSADAGTRVWEAALLAVPPYAGVATVNEILLNGQRRAELQVFYAGSRLLACPLPPQSSLLRGVLFTDGSLFVIADRADGGYALESYSLNGLSVKAPGWSASEGAQGGRRPQ